MRLRQLILIIGSYRKAYTNYLGILVTSYIKRKASYHGNVNLEVRLRDRRTVVVPYGWAIAYPRLLNIENKNISELSLNWNGLSFKYKGNIVIFDLARFSDLDGVFFHEDYKFLGVREKDVIDIGANIGDSAIYFSLNGAKRVIALEPYPYAYSFAERNVKLNDIRNVVLLNAAYGKDSKIIVDREKISSTGSILVPSSRGNEISVLSLKTLINNYNIRNAALKMDCEGCEYALIDEDDQIFNNIDTIQVEYHYDYENLVNKFKKCGFDVQYTRFDGKYEEQTKEQGSSHSSSAENLITGKGFIYARRSA
jgi:FkbM family methyltransferase